MRSRPRHLCRLIGSPWPEVFGTDTDSAVHYDRHWHTTIGFGIIARGAHRSLSGRGIVDAHAGDIVTNNPGEVHDGRPLGAETRRWRMVYLELPLMSAVAGEPETAAVDVRFTRPVIRDAFVFPVIRQLMGRLDEWNTASRSSADTVLACEEALVRACGLLLKRHSTAVSRAESCGDVAQARERLADDLIGAPSLAELAASAGLSRYQLLRRFERVYGMTPFQWQRQVRVERARVLIGAGCNLAQVAADCGFADQSHMTRAFVKHFGFTPGAWASSR